MSTPKKARRPAGSALLYLSKMMKRDEIRVEKAVRRLTTLELYREGGKPLAYGLRHALAVRHKKHVEVARNHWGKLEVDEALKQLRGEDKHY